MPKYEHIRNVRKRITTIRNIAAHAGKASAKEKGAY
jgi:hypothetical protein